MKTLATAALALISLSVGAVRADEGVKSASPVLRLQAKLALDTAPPSLQARAPFNVVPGEHALDLLPREEDARMKASRSSCNDQSRSLCYDTGTNKIVYKKTRDYMLQIPGMRAEHVSLRRDRITFKYSFR